MNFDLLQQIIEKYINGTSQTYSIDNYPNFIKAVQQNELKRELEYLITLLEQSESFSEKFKERCAWREKNPTMGIPFSEYPLTLTNRLYWDLAEALFAPKKMQNMLEILIPDLQFHLSIILPIHKKSDKERLNIESMEHVLVKKLDYLSEFDNPPSLKEFSCYVFADNMILNINDIFRFNLNLHVKLKKILDTDYPKLAQKLYSHNSSLEYLHKDIELRENKGMTPQRALEDLIRGLKQGGETLSGQTYATKPAKDAIERFFSYFNTLPEERRNIIRNLGNHDDTIGDIFDKEIDKGECVETSASGLEDILTPQIIKNTEELHKPLSLSEEQLKELNKKYPQLQSFVIEKTDEQLKIPEVIAIHLLQKINSVSLGFYITLLLQMPVELYADILKNLTFYDDQGTSDDDDDFDTNEDHPLDVGNEDIIIGENNSQVEDIIINETSIQTIDVPLIIEQKPTISYLNFLRLLPHIESGIFNQKQALALLQAGYSINNSPSETPILVWASGFSQTIFQIIFNETSDHEKLQSINGINPLIIFENLQYAPQSVSLIMSLIPIKKQQIFIKKVLDYEFTKIASKIVPKLFNVPATLDICFNLLAQDERLDWYLKTLDVVEKLPPEYIILADFLLITLSENQKEYALKRRAKLNLPGFVSMLYNDKSRHLISTIFFAASNEQFRTLFFNTCKDDLFGHLFLKSPGDIQSVFHRLEQLKSEERADFLKAKSPSGNNILHILANHSAPWLTEFFKLFPSDLVLNQLKQENNQKQNPLDLIVTIDKELIRELYKIYPIEERIKIFQFCLKNNIVDFFKDYLFFHNCIYGLPENLRVQAVSSRLPSQKRSFLNYLAQHQPHVVIPFLKGLTNDEERNSLLASVDENESSTILFLTQVSAHYFKDILITAPQDLVTKSNKLGQKPIDKLFYSFDTVSIDKLDKSATLFIEQLPLYLRKRLFLSFFESESKKLKFMSTNFLYDCIALLPVDIRLSTLKEYFSLLISKQSVETQNVFWNKNCIDFTDAKSFLSLFPMNDQRSLILDVKFPDGTNWIDHSKNINDLIYIVDILPDQEHDRFIKSILQSIELFNIFPSQLKSKDTADVIKCYILVKKHSSPLPNLAQFFSDTRGMAIDQLYKELTTLDTREKIKARVRDYINAYPDTPLSKELLIAFSKESNKSNLNINWCRY